MSKKLKVGDKVKFCRGNCWIGEVTDIHVISDLLTNYEVDWVEYKKIEYPRKALRKISETKYQFILMTRRQENA